ACGIAATTRDGPHGAADARAGRNAVRGNCGDAAHPGGHGQSEGLSRKVKVDANKAGVTGSHSLHWSNTMNVTREVVTDLLPIYFSSDASKDTKALVEDYFRENPDFERIARSAATPLEALRAAPPIAAGSEKERRDLENVRCGLQRRKWFFGLSLFL